MHIVHALLHLDQFLTGLSSEYGNYLYLILFFILFAETGLVIAPFLPGDSLLFAVGAMTSLGEGSLAIENLSLLFLLSTFLGDNCNYYLASRWGRRLFIYKRGPLRPENLMMASAFYQKHGPLALILARFIPVVRTFVPFAAGLAQMPMRRYLAFSFLGSLLWTQSFLWMGRVFGRLPEVQKNFHFVVVGVILISVLPLIIKSLSRKKQET